MALSLRFGAVSDIGRTRKKNDDSGYAGPHFAMVADGMGGAAAGDLASAVAVQTMLRLDVTAPDNPLEALAGAVHRANDRLAELIEEDKSVEGMGTTVTAVLFDGEQIAVAHLGDSRGYLWHDGELLRITADHTWVQSLIDEGRITEEEAKVHSHRSLLLKVLDGRHDNDPDLARYDVQAGDRILLCSDGLTGFVDHDRISRVLSIGSAASVASELVQLALEAASTDNVTVVVVDVVDEPPDESAPLIVGAAADHPRGTISRFRTWAHRDELEPSEALVAADADPEHLRYAPREPHRLRWLRSTLVFLVILGVLAAAAFFSYTWSQRQYYVAAHAGHVAIFKGVQASMPGIRLHRVHEESDLLVSELPSIRRGQVFEGMTADNLTDAQNIVKRLNTFARTCANQTSGATSSTPTSGTSRSRPPSTARSTRSGQGPRTPPAAGSRTPGTRTPGTTKNTGTKAPASARTATTGTTGPTGGSEESSDCSGATVAAPSSTPSTSGPPS